MQVVVLRPYSTQGSPISLGGSILPYSDVKLDILPESKNLQLIVSDFVEFSKKYA
jgi:hypothetical protein